MPYAQAGRRRRAGGAANLVGLIERKRAAAPGPVILLDAGDAFQGTYISNSNHGEAVVEMMNVREWTQWPWATTSLTGGWTCLESASAGRFPVLAANLEQDDGQSLPGIEPYVILDAGGVRVGVLGLTYHDIKNIVAASSIEGLRSLASIETVR